MYDSAISKKRAEIKIYSDLISQLEADGCEFDVSDEELIAEHHPNCVNAARQLRERYNQIDNARELRHQLTIEVIDMARELLGAANIATGWGHPDEKGRVDISTNVKVEILEGEDENFEYYALR